MDDTVVEYTAQAGELNDAEFSSDTAHLTVRDPGAVIVPESPCEVVPGTDSHTARCPLTLPPTLYADLGDEADTGSISLPGESTFFRLEAGPGSDVVTTEEGYGIVRAGPGNDQVALALGSFHGGPDDDILYAARGSGTGDEGNDLIRADVDGGLEGGPGDDHITGGTGSPSTAPGANGAQYNRLSGGDGNDVLVGRGGSRYVNDRGDKGDNLYGGAGDDELIGSIGWDFLYGGPGTDRLAAGDGPDTLEGGTEDDLLEGGDGPDTLWGGHGADVQSGGGDQDSANFGDQPAGVRVVLGDATGGATSGGDRVLDAEVVQGTDFADELIGDDQDNILVGLGGDDKIDAGTGRDSVSGGRGDDDIDVADRQVVGEFELPTAPILAEDDQVRCEGGDDVARIDPLDHAECEVRLVVSTPISVGGNGVAEVPLICPDEALVCSGQATLAGGAGVATAAAILGRSRFALERGHRDILRVRLGKKPRKSIRRRRVLRATLQTRLRGQSGTTVQAVTLKPRPRIRAAGRCETAVARVRLAGPDLRFVRQVRYLVDGRPPEIRTVSPFAALLAPAELATGRAVATLADGRQIRFGLRRLCR